MPGPSIDRVSAREGWIWLFVSQSHISNLGLNYEYTHTFANSNQLHACRHTTTRRIILYDGVTSYANGKQWLKKASQIDWLNIVHKCKSLLIFLSVSQLFLVPDTVVTRIKLSIDFSWYSIVSKHRSVHQSFVFVVAYIKIHHRLGMFNEI